MFQVLDSGQRGVLEHPLHLAGYATALEVELTFPGAVITSTTDMYRVNCSFKVDILPKTVLNCLSPYGIQYNNRNLMLIVRTFGRGLEY